MHSRSPDLEKRFRWVAGCFFAVAGPPAEGAVPKTTGAARSLDARPQVPILHRSGQIDLYTTIISQPSFWRVVQKLNGRRLVKIIVALLELWIEGEAVLEGAPGYSRDP